MDIFQALAEPTRRNIIEIIASKGEISASAISNRFDISAPAVSQHLKVLKEANLVIVQKRAQQRIYQINPDSMTELKMWVDKMTQLWTQRFDALDKLLEEEKAKIAKK